MRHGRPRVLTWALLCALSLTQRSRPRQVTFSRYTYIGTRRNVAHTVQLYAKRRHVRSDASVREPARPQQAVRSS
eukprot:157401-Prymnesium_polylepis.1